MNRTFFFFFAIFLNFIVFFYFVSFGIALRDVSESVLFVGFSPSCTFYHTVVDRDFPLVHTLIGYVACRL